MTPQTVTLCSPAVFCLYWAIPVRIQMCQSIPHLETTSPTSLLDDCACSPHSSKLSESYRTGCPSFCQMHSDQHFTAVVNRTVCCQDRKDVHVAKINDVAWAGPDFIHPLSTPSFSGYKPPSFVSLTTVHWLHFLGLLGWRFVLSTIRWLTCPQVPS